MAKAPSTEKGKSRWYPCPRCGDQHPSVTTLLDVIGSRVLMNWIGKNGTAKLNVYREEAIRLMPGQMARLVDQRAEALWKLKETTAFFKSGKEAGQEAADYGTIAHDWIDHHLRGTDKPLDLLPEPSRNSVQEMLRWEKEHNLETIATEQTFYNCALNYAGTADWLGKLDRELSMGDWKTSSGIYLNYVIQGWLYALADETQNADRLYRQIFIGRFGKDGSSDVKIFKRNEFPSMDLARDMIIACGVIFKAGQEWDEKFPYIRKKKEIPA